MKIKSDKVESKKDNSKGNEDSNIIPIMLKESEVKIGEIKITYHKPKPKPTNLRKLFSFKHKQNHEGKS
jgi:hypothetical protein